MSEPLNETLNQETNTDSVVVEPDAVVGEELPATTKAPGSAGGTGLFAGEEKVISIDELEEEQEYSDEDLQNFKDLYEGTISEFVEGEVVTGKIIAIGTKEVSIDIGFKSEGVVAIDEFSNRDSLEIGQDIEVFLDNVEDSDGQLVLSREKAEFMRDWARVVDSFNNGDVLEGRCVRRIKGGMVVDLNGVDAFLPGSQIDVRPIRDFDAFIGRTMDFRIVKVNELRKNIVVSHRVLVEEQLVGQRKKILDNLEKGQVLEGTVKNITDFGVFIDLGGVDGLLHINDLSWGRVNHPSEIVSLDEKIKVQVLDFNEDKNRISLGLKQLQPHPWVQVEETYPLGSVITGKVVSISDYGAFIELEKGVEGLIHISEMSWTQHIRHPSKILSVGEQVETKVLNLDVEERKISLGLKQLEPDPWEQIEEKFPVDSQQNGIVRNLTAFGAFIELEEGIDGLVHISDLSWTKKIRHPGEVLKKGDEVEVVVLNLDKNNRRISLGYKQTMDNPWDQFEDVYTSGKKTSGKIVRMIDKGVITELPEGVDGFVPISHLAKENLHKPSEGYTVGDTLELVVIEFNKENKKIILSERLARREEGDDKKKKAEAVAEKEAAEVVEPETAVELADQVDDITDAKAETPVDEIAEAEAEASNTARDEIDQPDESAKAETESSHGESEAETEAAEAETPQEDQGASENDEKAEKVAAKAKTKSKSKTKTKKAKDAEADEPEATDSDKEETSDSAAEEDKQPEPEAIASETEEVSDSNAEEHRQSEPDAAGDEAEAPDSLEKK
jgi:small subunit ribosomal protein S1